MIQNRYNLYYLLILLFSLVVNWPIFFSDLLVNDDLTIVAAKLLGDYDGLRAVFYDQAKPSGYYLHRALMLFSPGGKTFYLVVNFACISASAMLLFTIVVQAWRVTTTTALMIAFGLLCFPAFGIQPFAVATLKFIANTTLFAGIFLAFKYWRGQLTWPWLILAVLCIAESALHPSSIPFMYAFFLSFLLIELHGRMTQSDYQRASLIKGFAVCSLLTVTVVLVFFIESLLFEQHEFFRGSYNQLKFDFMVLIKGLYDGIMATFWTQFLRLFDISQLRVVLLVLLTIAVVAWWFVCTKKQSVKDLEANENQNHCWFLLFMVLVFLVLAVFPYAAVGKIPTPDGYQSRWASYVGVGGGLFLGFLYELSRLLKPKAIQGWVLAVAVFFMSLFTSFIWDHYGKWQRVAIENNAMIAKLKSLPYNKDIDFYCVDTDIVSEEFYFRRWYDWAHVFSQSWPTERKTMGSNISYCEKRNFYQDGQLKPELSLVAVIGVGLLDMDGLVKWMYYGNSKKQYRMGRLSIDVGDKRLDQLQGAEIVLESLKHKFIGSDVIDSYYSQMKVSY